MPAISIARPHLLGVSVRRLAVNDETFDEAWSSELAVAMLGLPVAKNLQTRIHRRLRADIARVIVHEETGLYG